MRINLEASLAAEQKYLLAIRFPPFLSVKTRKLTSAENILRSKYNLDNFHMKRKRNAQKASCYVLQVNKLPKHTQFWLAKNRK